MADIVAIWDVPLSDKNHRIELEHGTLSGKRVIRVDGKEILKKDWMFKLVGSESFEIGRAKCVITIQAIGGFTYEYSLSVNGKLLEKFRENQSKVMKTWLVQIVGEPTRIVLEKDTLDVWINGQKAETAGEFVEDGTETHFSVGDYQAYIKAVSTGNKRKGIVHSLFVNDVEIPESVE